MLKLDFLKNLKKMNRNTILVSIAIIGIIITGALIFADSSKGFSVASIFGMSSNEIGKKTIDYINNNGLSQTPASLVSVSEESGVVKVKIKIGTNEFDSYATKDGKFLFPESFDMSAKKDGATSGATNTTPTTVQKTDKPELDAFVVARCPYGLQMQRAMAEAVKNQPALAQYIKARYIGSVSGNTITAMHGDAEAQENLRQICIREEQPAKYWSYVACQMKASGTEKSCEQSTGVDSAKLSACISSPSKGVAYAQKDFDLATKYNVTGSPTLILNGSVIDETNYGGRSADGVRSMVCGGFNTEAGFCSTKLNTASAASSFSAEYASAAGSADSTAGCE